MKLLFASDIHGSAYFAKLLLEAFKREAADRMLLLGDLLYHGPRNDLPRDYAPKTVIELLNQAKESLFCVRGNCEAEVDQMVLDFPVLAEYALLSIEGKTIFATHGHHHSFDSLPPLKQGDIFLQGHTHVPKCENRNGIICMNPGSVSIPKENSANGYMIFDGKTFEWKTLEGEVYMSF